VILGFLKNYFGFGHLFDMFGHFLDSFGHLDIIWKLYESKNKKSPTNKVCPPVH
jgi:hypothetical protein